MGVSLTVNGTPVEVRVDGTTSLILALRNEGTRFGCGGEDCGDDDGASGTLRSPNGRASIPSINGARGRRDNTCRRSAGRCCNPPFFFCRRKSCPTQTASMSR
jgi:hypothetical protein